MSKISRTKDEQARLLALKSYNILDTVEEGEFDDLTTLAAHICQVPIVLISLVDENRQWFKSHIGLEASETPIEQSFCAHAISSGNDMMIVEDAHQDRRFMHNPLVTGSPNITFYAGVPLTSKDGYSLGTLCVIDPNRRELTWEQKHALKVIAKQVMDKLELRKQLLEMEALNLSLKEAEAQSANLLQNLELSSSRIESLIQQAPVAIIVFRGSELRIESVNPRMLELLDKQADILGKPLLEALPELSGQRPFNLLHSVLETGDTIFGDDTPVDLKRNGKIERGYFNFTYAPLIEDGKVTGVIDMAVNVTKQVLAQQSKQELNDQLKLKNEELALINSEVISVNDSLTNAQAHLSILNSRLMESEMNLQTLADNISQLAWMADANGNVYWYNKRWSDYTGQDLEQMQNGGWEIVSHPEHNQRVVAKYKNHIAAGNIWEDTFPLLSGDGKYRWFLSRAVPLKGENGQVIRWLGTNTDITERKEFEQRKDDFLGVVSHELKNPITTIKANLQLLDRVKDNPENQIATKLIHSSNRSVEKINSLLDDLLNMRRFGEGQLKLEKNSFKILQMLNLSCNHVRIAGKYQLVVCGDEHLEVSADEHRIDQVVVNLVNNAVKYAPSSEKIDLTVSQDGDYAKISVRDYGAGIPKDQLPFLFDRYWRASHSGKTYSGLGLGLYICAEIIKKHGGEIGVESEIGKGSTFWFTLPLKI